MKTQSITLFVLFLTVLLCACSANIERNQDGSLRIETTMTEQAIRAEIQRALADPLVQNLTVTLHNGYITVNGERRRANGDQIDSMSFRLDLGASNGHMTAVISNAMLNDIPIEQERVDRWNQRIAEGLERAGQNRPNSSLQSVTIQNEAITLVWRVETQRSRGD